MQFISCHDGRIFKTAGQWAGPRKRGFQFSLPALDGLLPDGGIVRGAVHEVLSLPQQPVPRFFALLLARSVGGVIVWCDPKHTLYPPAVAAAGVSMERLFLLHPNNQTDQSWAIAECMQCKGVAATIAQVGKLSRIETRKYQLAAEKGGGIGILLRPLDRHATLYSAATRWLVSPCPGTRIVQRWTIQLLHAHGGQIGKTVIMEHHRETNTLCAVEQLVDRSGESKTIRISA